MSWIETSIQMRMSDETRRALSRAYNSLFPEEPRVILTLFKSKSGGVLGFGWVGELVDEADTQIFPEGYFIRIGDFDIYVRNQGASIAELDGSTVEYDTLIVQGVSISPA